jgi:hypothetical protein
VSGGPAGQQPVNHLRFAALALGLATAAASIIFGYGELNARITRLEADVAGKVDLVRFDDVCRRLTTIEGDIKEILRRTRE